MSHPSADLEQFAPYSFRFYRHAIALLQDAGLPFLLGGAYAFGYYTGICRHTKDLDLFVKKGDVKEALAIFAAAGYRSELVFTHWLGKAYHGDDFVDVIYSSGNGLCPVDQAWFDHSVTGRVLGAEVRLIPAEEMIWQKAFIMERERFDGADVAHLIQARGERLDWDRLIARFGDHWRVLLAHLVLFGFVYPGERARVPPAVLEMLTTRLRGEGPESGDGQVCRGTILSRMQYLADTEEWGYADPRLQPAGPMTPEEVHHWTEAGR